MSVNEFSTFPGFLFIIFISFLQESAFLVIALVHSFSIFIMGISFSVSLLNSVPVRLARSVWLFSRGNSLDLFIGSGSFASYILQTLWVENKQISTGVFKGRFYVGVQEWFLSVQVCIIHLSLYIITKSADANLFFFVKTVMHLWQWRMHMLKPVGMVLTAIRFFFIEVWWL